MAKLLPTLEAIRRMDGDGLTRLARRLGLDPSDPIWRWAWEPHDNLDQAYKLLLACRTRNWTTNLNYEGLLRYGSVSVGWQRCLFAGEDMVSIVDADIAQITDSEATAIVRAVCLAVVDAQGQEGKP